MILCPALKEANITNPNIREAINFCTEQCPYNKCIIAEGGLPQINLAKKKLRAINLRKKGVTTKEIAIVLEKSIKTVRRYLK